MPSHHTPVWHGKGCNHFNSEHYTNRRYSFGIAGDKFSSLNIRKGVFKKNLYIHTPLCDCLDAAFYSQPAIQGCNC